VTQVAVEQASGPVGLVVIAAGALFFAQGLIAWRARHDPWFSRHRWLRRFDVVPNAIGGMVFGALAVVSGLIVLVR
jgi:hypothetical protein